jgi:protein gp37
LGRRCWWGRPADALGKPAHSEGTSCDSEGIGLHPCSLYVLCAPKGKGIAMARDSAIEWTDHTFNPWWGCVAVSPACDHCYAEALAKRFGYRTWGARAPRRFFGDAHWSEPLKWHSQAEKAGQRMRVFCASMADVFEKQVELDSHRERLWKLIKDTPALDWLLLTKRPQLIADRLPRDWGAGYANVWLGTTVENHMEATRRLPHLMAVPAAVHFVSAEPLLSAIDLRQWLDPNLSRRLGWVIAGGESGPRARPSDPSWFRDLRDQCLEAKVPFHFKQWGNWAPNADGQSTRQSKAGAGRALDGRTWDQLPMVAALAQ